MLIGTYRIKRFNGLRIYVSAQVVYIVQNFTTNFFVPRPPAFASPDFKRFVGQAEYPSCLMRCEQGALWNFYTLHVTSVRLIGVNQIERYTDSPQIILWGVIRFSYTRKKSLSMIFG